MSSFTISDSVPVGGFCILDEQCKGSYYSGLCDNGRCNCAKGLILIDLACKKGNSIHDIVFKTHTHIFVYDMILYE